MTKKEKFIVLVQTILVTDEDHGGHHISPGPMIASALRIPEEIIPDDNSENYYEQISHYVSWEYARNDWGTSKEELGPPPEWCREYFENLEKGKLNA